MRLEVPEPLPAAGKASLILAKLVTCTGGIRSPAPAIWRTLGEHDDAYHTKYLRAKRLPWVRVGKGWPTGISRRVYSALPCSASIQPRTLPSDRYSATQIVAGCEELQVGILSPYKRANAQLGPRERLRPMAERAGLNRSTTCRYLVSAYVLAGTESSHACRRLFNPSMCMPCTFDGGTRREPCFCILVY